MLVNTHGNIDQFNRSAPLENKDMINKKNLDVYNCLWKYSSRSETVYFSDESRGRQKIFMCLAALLCE